MESGKFLKDRELRRGPIIKYNDTRPTSNSYMEYVRWSRVMLKFSQDSPFYQTRIPSLPTPLKCSSKMSKKRKRCIKDLQDRIRHSHTVMPKKILKVAGFLKTSSSSIDLSGRNKIFDPAALEDLFPKSNDDKTRSFSFQEGQDDIVHINAQDEDGEEIDAGDYTRNYNESDDEGDIGT